MPFPQPIDVIPKHRFVEGASASKDGKIKYCDVPGCGQPMSAVIHHLINTGEEWPKGMPRFTRDDMLMAMAETVRKRSTCLRGQVGVVIARDGRIVSMGYNGSPPGVDHCTEVGCEPEDGCERTIHAEANALVWAARAGITTEGAVMYSTHSPCRTCAQLIASAGIEEFMYVRPYRAERLDILTASKVKVTRIEP